MLYDLIAVSEEDFDNFIENIDGAIIQEGAHWKHANPSPHESVSVKVDKYFEDKFKNIVSLSRPKQGAFCGKSILQLLEPHSGNRYVLLLDIKNFFGSIGFCKIEKCINDNPELGPYRGTIRALYFGSHDRLRRGLKGSSAIAEIVGLEIDRIVKKAIHSEGLTYSRYYDDIIISCRHLDTLRSISSTLPESIYEELGLSFNPKKTKLRRLHGSRVLGLRFHKEGITVPQSFKHKLRAVIYEYNRADYDETDYESVRDAKRHVGRIIGMLRYVVNFTSADVSRYDDCLADFYEELDRLEGIRKELAQYGDDETLSRIVL